MPNTHFEEEDDDDDVDGQDELLNQVE